MFAARAVSRIRSVIVTGGGTGIGLAIAQATRRARRQDRDRQPQLRQPRARLAPSCATPASIRSPSRWTSGIPSRSTRWRRASCKHFGRIDMLVNNAAGNFICRAEDLSPNGWNAVIGIVLNGTFYCSRAVGRHMIARGGGGSIVSILANYVWTGSAGTVHSAAAKAGVMSMTQTLAVEWARHRIRVNAVAPGRSSRRARPSSSGTRRRPSIASRRWCRSAAGRQPDEIADAVAFLVSAARRLHHRRNADDRRRGVAGAGPVRLRGTVTSSAPVGERARGAAGASGG